MSAIHPNADASASGAPLSVALVMPVRNEEAEVDSTMAAVLASTRLPDEIVIADAQSTDATVAKLQPWIEKANTLGVPMSIVPNPSIFCGGGRNIGAQNTNCDLIVIADFGNPMYPEYIEKMVAPFADDAELDATLGILLPLMQTPFERCMGIIYYADNIILQEMSIPEREALLPEVLLPGGGCIALRREFMLEMGGYPEWLARSQDRLFSLKAYCHGAKVKVAWDAKTLNHVRSGPGAVYKMAFGWARCNGQSRYLRRHALKAAPLYALLTGLLMLGFWTSIGPLVAFLLFSAYVGKAAVRRLRQIDGKVKHLSYLWHSATILAAGDLGTIFGQCVGWFEWLTNRDYRTKFWAYMESCPRSRLHVIER